MRSAAALASALVVGIVMLVPPTASADHDLTCHPPSGGGGTPPTEYLSFNFTQVGIALGFSVDSQGAVRPRGVVRLEGAILRPQAGGSSAQCADTNGNGIAGLTQAQIVLQEGRTGPGWVVHILPQLEMDARGRYAGAVEICDARACTRHEVEIRALVTWFR